MYCVPVLVRAHARLRAASFPAILAGLIAVRSTTGYAGHPAVPCRLRP
jgi:hypothetical protein